MTDDDLESGAVIVGENYSSGRIIRRGELFVGRIIRRGELFVGENYSSGRIIRRRKYFPDKVLPNNISHKQLPNYRHSMKFCYHRYLWFQGFDIFLLLPGISIADTHASEQTVSTITSVSYNEKCHLDLCLNTEPSF